MSYFPLCINLTGQRVLLIGEGPQTKEKLEKLLLFAPRLIRLPALREEDLYPRPVLVVVGDLDREASCRCSELCRERNIPVNVVDQPELCTFYFPALIRRGEMSIAITTGGVSPAAAAFLRRQIEQQLPLQTEEIIAWLDRLRRRLGNLPPVLRRRILKEATEEAFFRGYPLTEEEECSLMEQQQSEFA